MADSRPAETMSRTIMGFCSRTFFAESLSALPRRRQTYEVSNLYQ